MNDECPKPGLCLDLESQAHDAKQALLLQNEHLQRHDSALERIGAGLDSLKSETHEIRVTLRERDKLGGFLQTVFVSLLAVTLVHFGAGIWWAATMSSSIRTLGDEVTDHRATLRAHAKYIDERTGREWNRP